MHTYADKTSSNRSRAIANHIGGNTKPVLQRARYKSKKDETFTVVTESGTGGAFATATEGDKVHDQSSLQYKLKAYMDAGADMPEPKATKVAMATQTDTMKAIPEQKGVGTLIVHEALQHLENNGIKYLQPDILKSPGGNIMAALVEGKKIGSKDMETLIEKTDGTSNVKTYPAIEVDYGASKAKVTAEVTKKFEEVKQ